MSKGNNIILMVLIIFAILFNIFYYLNKLKSTEAQLYTFTNNLACGQPKCPVNLDLTAKFDANNLLTLSYYLANAVANFVVSFSNTMPNLTTKQQLYLSKNDKPIGVVCTDSNLPDTAFIIFRGTQTLTDILEDAKFNQVPLDEKNTDVMVHSGFLDSFNRVRDDMQSAITAIKPKTVYIAGHSLGGALSIITGLNIAINMQDTKVAVITFASPLIGNSGFSTVCNAVPNLKISRVVNTCDVIPTLPAPVSPNKTEPSKPYFYEHINLPIFEFTENRKSILNNHFISVYLDNIKQAITNV